MGAVVELVIFDQGSAFPAYHPMHLHGYSFRVVGMGKVGYDTIRKTRVDSIPREHNLHVKWLILKIGGKDNLT